jgi:epoxyqueuosine reductase
MTAIHATRPRSAEAILDGLAAILARQEVELWGTAPSSAMEGEPPGQRPSDLLLGARSLIGFGIPVPQGIFHQRRYVVESNWRTQNIYYRKLDDLSMRLAVRLEKEGERAIPVLGCLPVETRAPFTLAGYLNQIRIGEATRIGTRGRNGLLFHPRHGSRLMLGGVVTTAALPSHTEPAPVETGCPADCRRCVEVCPIAAIRPEEHRVDSPACLRFTSRTPLLPKWRYLWLHLTGRRHKANRLLNITSFDEHTFHVCSRCFYACPSEVATRPPNTTRVEPAATRTEHGTR